MSDEGRSEVRRVSDWLSGEVRVSRKVLVAGAVLIAILFGIALD